jgi:Domain of unknown function (DUF397)
MALTPTWTKSSFSDPNGGNCVEARQPGSGTVQVRDSKNSAGPVLTVTPAAWMSFISGVRNAPRVR